MMFLSSIAQMMISDVLVLQILSSSVEFSAFIRVQPKESIQKVRIEEYHKFVLK